MYHDDVKNNISSRFLILHRVTNSLEKFSYKINIITHTGAGILLFLLMLVTVVDVIGRYFFNNPITGTLDFTKVTLAIIVFFSLGYAQIKGDHLQIDFLTSKFTDRVQNIFKVITFFIMFIVLSMLTWQMFLYGINTSPSEYSGDLSIPLYIFILLVAIGSLTFTFTYLVLTLKYFLKVVSKLES